MELILLLFLPALFLCDHIEWQPIAKLGRLRSGQRWSFVSSDGTVNLILKVCLRFNQCFMQHQRYHPNNKTVSASKNISGRLSTALESISRECDAHSSVDGKHIAVAYLVDRGRSVDLYYTESFDGGSNWAEAVNVASTTDEKKSYPLVLLDDTGRVYVAYTNHWSRKLVVREPGARNFGSSGLLFRSYGSEKERLAFSFDRKNSKRYLHFFWQGEKTTIYANGIYYIKSADNGKTWSKPVILAQFPATDAVNFETAVASMDGRLYMQYSLGVEWSKDHGSTWEQTLSGSYGYFAGYDLTVCGEGSQRRVFRCTRSIEGEITLLALKPDARVAEPMKIPFPGKHKGPTTHLGCGIDGQGRMAVTFILGDYFSRPDFMSYGVLRTV